MLQLMLAAEVHHSLGSKTLMIVGVFAGLGLACWLINRRGGK